MRPSAPNPSAITGRCLRYATNARSTSSDARVFSCFSRTTAIQGRNQRMQRGSKNRPGLMRRLPRSAQEFACSRHRQSASNESLAKTRSRCLMAKKHGQIALVGICGRAAEFLHDGEQHLQALALGLNQPVTHFRLAIHCKASEQLRKHFTLR